MFSEGSRGLVVELLLNKLFRVGAVNTQDLGIGSEGTE